MQTGLIGRRRTDLIILAVSLLISAVIWLIHYLSQDYMAYLPFRVNVETSIDGFSNKAISNETLVLGGQATGFYILGRRSPNTDNSVRITLDPKILIREGEGRFCVEASSIREALSDAVGADFDISYVQDIRLSFDFVPQSFVKLPVNSHINVKCKGQYMPVSDIVLKPDSVTVYGNTAELKDLEAIDTKAVTIKDVASPLNGMVDLNTAGFRVEPSKVEYSLDVKRYVEYRFTSTITSAGVPKGKKLIFLPSRVEVVCRLPFGVKSYPLRESGALVVDYDDFLSSGSTRVAPKLSAAGVPVLDCHFNPPFVECVLSQSE